MNKKSRTSRRYKLIQDLIAAREDLMSLAKKHRLSADGLAKWIADTQNQRVLGGLCLLADLQTQVLLSRYRLLAASRLIKLATQEDGEGGTSGGGSGGDVARRACVDLLKLDLKRADLSSLQLLAADDHGGKEAGGADDDIEALRRLLYGQSDQQDKPREQEGQTQPVEDSGPAPELWDELANGERERVG